MWRRKMLGAISVLVVAVLVAAGVVILWPPSNRITSENCDRIREGMTRAQVAAILGPPGDYRTRPSKAGWGTADPVEAFFSRPRLHNADVEWWLGDDIWLVAIFDPEDRLGRKKIEQPPQGDGSLWDTLCWRAGRQWRKCFQK